MKLTVTRTTTLYPGGGDAPAGHYRIGGKTPPNGHPADGMTIRVAYGDGAVGTIINPQSFEDGGPEWVMRYGNPESIRYTVASILKTYDYLLSGHITTKEAIRRLSLMRAVRRAALEKEEI